MEEVKSTEVKADEASKATFNIWDWIQTRPGALTASGVVGGLVTAVTAFILAINPYLTGEKKVSSLLEGQVLHVVIDKMPDLHVKDSTADPIPIPVPKPANVKPLTIIAIGKQLEPSFIDALKARGHTFTYYETTPSGWDGVFAKYGPPPGVYVADKEGVRGAAVGQPAADFLIKTWEAK